MYIDDLPRTEENWSSHEGEFSVENNTQRWLPRIIKRGGNFTVKQFMQHPFTERRRRDRLHTILHATLGVSHAHF